MIEGKDRCTATLEYTIFLDWFDPEFYMCTLTAMGYPEGLANVQRAIYGNLIRHIKVAGSYGEPLHATCDVGQGCSLTLLAANATVITEFNMLSHREPQVCKTTLVDDRTLDAEDLQQLSKAIEEVVDMDRIMGHETNIEKSKILTTTRRTRKRAGNMLIKGIKIQLVHDFKLLAHRCVGIRKYITRDAEAAAQEARLRINRIQHLPIPQSGKVHVVNIGNDGGLSYDAMEQANTTHTEAAQTRRAESNLGDTTPDEMCRSCVGSDT